MTLVHEGRRIRIGTFPIGIEPTDWLGRLEEGGVGERIRVFNRQYGGLSKYFGLDRLDYIKGIPNKIRAYGRLLDLHPELKEEVGFMQIVVPSRADVPEYQRLKLEVEQIVGEINGRHGMFLNSDSLATC